MPDVAGASGQGPPAGGGAGDPAAPPDRHDPQVPGPDRRPARCWTSGSIAWPKRASARPGSIPTPTPTRSGPILPRSIPTGRLRLAESYEPVLLGSAGTVAANADLADDADLIVIIYADNFSDIDLRPLLAFPPQPRRSVHHGPVPRPRSPGLRDRRAGRRGDGSSRSSRSPSEPASDLANAGVYVVDAPGLPRDRRDAGVRPGLRGPAPVRGPDARLGLGGLSPGHRHSRGPGAGPA